MPDSYDNEIFYAENFPVPPVSSHRPCEFIECQFTGIDFTKFNFSCLKFLDCEFIECNLSNVSLKSASFREVTFKKSKLLGINWSVVSTLVNASFYECILDYSVFHSLNLKGVTFSDCKMVDVDFYESNLSKASFTESFLRGAQFNKADLAEADFRGARDYFIDVRHTNIKRAKFSLPEALALLSSLEVTLE